jgi:hypothetical protein
MESEKETPGGQFRARKWRPWGESVRWSGRVANRRDGATHARTGGKAPSSESARKRRERSPPEDNGGGNVAVIETSPHRTASGVRGGEHFLRKSTCQTSRVPQGFTMVEAPCRAERRRDLLESPRTWSAGALAEVTGSPHRLGSAGVLRVLQPATAASGVGLQYTGGGVRRAGWRRTGPRGGADGCWNSSRPTGSVRSSNR